MLTTQAINLSHQPNPMLTSQVITRLQKLQEKYGDLIVTGFYEKGNLYQVIMEIEATLIIDDINDSNPNGELTLMIHLYDHPTYL